MFVRCDPYIRAAGPRDGAALLAFCLRHRFGHGAPDLLDSRLPGGPGCQRQRPAAVPAGVLRLGPGERGQSQLGHASVGLRRGHVLCGEAVLPDAGISQKLLRHRSKNR